MKQTVLMLALAFSAVVGNAQSFKKADKFVEGTVSYTKSTDVDATYSINPAVGYWLTDKVVVGVAGSFEKDAAKTTGFGVFTGCQFLKVGKINVISRLTLSSTTTDLAGAKTTAFNSGLGLGAYYFVTNKLALTMNLADLVSYSSADSKSTLTVGFDGVNNPFNAAKFGVTYRF